MQLQDDVEWQRYWASLSTDGQLLIYKEDAVSRFGGCTICISVAQGAATVREPKTRRQDAPDAFRLDVSNVVWPAKLPLSKIVCDPQSSLGRKEWSTAFAMAALPGGYSPGRQSLSDTTLCILLVILHTKHTGRRQNDFNVHA